VLAGFLPYFARFTAARGSRRSPHILAPEPSHDGRVMHLAANEDLCDDRNWTISIWRRFASNLDDELEHAYEKADLFEKVFQRKLQLLVQDQE
jgi:hypothetical protein